MVGISRFSNNSESTVRMDFLCCIFWKLRTKYFLFTFSGSQLKQIEPMNFDRSTMREGHSLNSKIR